MQLAAMFRADAVEHFGGVEGAGHGAGPAFAAENPAEQDGKDLVRVDEVAVLVGGADAVGVAVGAEAGVALVGDDCLAKRANMRLDGLGIDAGKERVDVAANLHVVDADAREDVGEDGAGPRRTWSRWQNFMPDLAIRSRSAKLSMALR